MIQAQGNEPSRTKTKMLAPQPVSMNTSDPLPNLPQGDYPILEDVLLRQGRIESRPYMTPHGIDGLSYLGEDQGGGESCTWQHGGERYGIFAEDEGSGEVPSIYYQSLSSTDDGANPIRKVVTSTGAPFSPAVDYTSLVPMGDKVFAFNQDGPPYVLEWSEADSRLEARTAGFTPAGYTVALDIGTLVGQYVYGVELVRKSGDATIASGGIYRTNSVSGEITRTVTNNSKVQISASLFASDANWTHIRLWRTKNLIVDPDTDVVRGQRNILFAIQEIDRASWTGDFAYDEEVDDNLPLVSLGALEASDGSFELLRLPAAEVAHGHEGKIWFAGTDLDEDNGQKVYLSKSQYTYAESYDPLDGEPTQNYDSGYIQGIFTLDGDVIIVRHSETGRIPTGDTLNGYYPTDRSRGFSRERMGNVYGVGLFACSPAGDIYRLGSSRVWEPVIAGSQTRLRGEFASDSVIYFSQYDGNVLVHERGSSPGEIYILNINDGLGWSRMSLADSHGPANASAIWHDPFGERTVFLIARHTNSYIHSMSLASGEDDYSTPRLNGDYAYTGESASDVSLVEVTHRVMFPPFQDGEGRAVYEHTYFSLIAALLDTTFDVECIGPDRDTVISTGSVEPNPSSFSNTDFDLYLEFTMQPVTPVYGTRVCYSVTTTGPFRITSAQVECIVGSVQARDYRPDLIPSEIASKDPLRNRSHWVTRGNPTRDIIAKQNIKEVS